MAITNVQTKRRPLSWKWYFFFKIVLVIEKKLLKFKAEGQTRRTFFFLIIVSSGFYPSEPFSFTRFNMRQLVEQFLKQNVFYLVPRIPGGFLDLIN